MPLYAPKPGYSDASSYILPGVPWTTSSLVNSGTIHEHTFWRVTKSVTVINQHGSYNIQVGFTKNGLSSTGSNYFEVPAGKVVPLDLRISKLYIKGSGSGQTPYSIIAAQSGVELQFAPELTGSSPPSGSMNGIG